MTAAALGPLAVDRRAQVLELLRHHGSARVADLAGLLGVTPVTIRRDVAYLAERGLVDRVHGGVTLPRAVRPPAGAEGLVGASAAHQHHAPLSAAVVGMLVPSQDYYWPGVARAVESAARVQGMRVVLRGSSYDTEDDRPQLERLVGHLGCDRLIIAPRTDIPSAHETLTWLAGTGVPTVLAERSADPGPELVTFDSVHSDHAAGAAAAVHHLAQLGHRRVGLVMSANSPTGPNLRRGWIDATGTLTRTIDVSTPDPGRPGWDDAVAAIVRDCLSSGTTALLVHADATAVALVQAFEHADVDVPRDVSVVAYDDEIAGLFSLPLTAVRPHRGALGRAALELLGARVMDPRRPAHHLLITPSLRLRESTAPARDGVTR
ncbi:substrate-binding domain-containing protein [Cellulomonas hominis]